MTMRTATMMMMMMMQNLNSGGLWWANIVVWFWTGPIKSALRTSESDGTKYNIKGWVLFFQPIHTLVFLRHYVFMEDTYVRIDPH